MDNAGNEVRTVSLQTAVTGMGTVVAIAMAVIMYMLGGANKEAAISKRLQGIETRAEVMEVRASTLNNAFNDHVSWSALRSSQVEAQLNDVQIRLSLLDNKVRGR